MDSPAESLSSSTKSTLRQPRLSQVRTVLTIAAATSLLSLVAASPELTVLSVEPQEKATAFSAETLVSTLLRRLFALSSVKRVRSLLLELLWVRMVALVASAMLNLLPLLRHQLPCP
jgi:hypothetical protein